MDQITAAPEKDDIPSTAQAFEAVKLILIFLDQNITALILIGLFSPALGLGWRRDWSYWNGAPYGFNYGLWALGFLLFSVLAAAAVSSCSIRFSGQLRYACTESRKLMTSFRKHFPWMKFSPLTNRSPHILVILLILIPDSWAFLLIFASGTAFAAWQYVLYSYRKAVQRVIAMVEESRYKSKVALHNGRQYAAAASKYHKQVVDLADTARRNERLTKSTDITDFFDKTATAWASMDRITASMRILTEKARLAKEHGQIIADPGPFEGETVDEDPEFNGENSEGNQMLDSATATLDLCEEIKKQLDYAQATIKDSGTAQTNFAEVRRLAAERARAVETALSELAMREKDNFNTLALAEQRFERVQWLADQAKHLAIRGDMNLAKDSALQAEEETKDVLKAESSAATVRDRAHQILLSLQAAKFSASG